MAVGRDDGTIVVWDVRADRVCQKLSGHGSGAERPGVCATAGGSMAGVGGRRRVGPDLGPEVGGQPAAHRSTAKQERSIRWPSGTTAGRSAAGGEDGMVRTWDPATGRADLASARPRCPRVGACL